MAYVHPVLSAAADDATVDPGAGVRPRSRTWPGCVTAVAAAAVLRFAFLGHNSAWFDEVYLVKTALAPWSQGLHLLRTAEFHPPLYYLVMHAWLLAAPLSDAVIRVPSACFGVLAVPLTAVFVRRVASGPASLLAAFFVAVSPFGVMAAQDARMYTLLGLLTLLSMLALEAATRRGGALRWGMYIAATGLALYTHYLAFLIVLAQGLVVVWTGRRALAAWLVAVATLAALYVPWAPSLWTQLSHAGAIAGPDPVTVQDLSQLLGLYAFGGSLLGMPSFFFRDTARSGFEQALLLGPFLGAAWLGLRAWWRERRGFAYVAVPLIVPIGLAFVSALVRPPFAARWFSFLVPFYAAILAAGVLEAAALARDHRPRVAAALVVCLLVYAAPVLGRYYFDPGFRPYNWRDAAALVRGRARPGDVFVYGGYQNELAFTYYFGPTAPEALLLPTMDIGAVARLGGGHRRLWLIVAPPLTRARLAETVETLRSRGGYAIAGRNRTGGSTVFPVVMLLQAAPSRVPAAAGTVRSTP